MHSLRDLQFASTKRVFKTTFITLALMLTLMGSVLSLSGFTQASSIRMAVAQAATLHAPATSAIPAKSAHPAAIPLSPPGPCDFFHQGNKYTDPVTNEEWQCVCYYK